MKHVLIVLALVFAGTAFADTLEQKRDAKLAEGWLSKSAWLTDWDKARAEAKESGKPIFGYFTRSYAH